MAVEVAKTAQNTAVAKMTGIEQERDMAWEERDAARMVRDQAAQEVIKVERARNVLRVRVNRQQIQLQEMVGAVQSIVTHSHALVEDAGRLRAERATTGALILPLEGDIRDSDQRRLAWGREYRTANFAVRC